MPPSSSLPCTLHACSLLVPAPPALTSSPVLAITRETTLLSTSPRFLILCYQDGVQELSVPGQPSASLHPDGGRPSWPDSPGPLRFPAQFFPPLLCFCFSLITVSFPASLK